VITDQATITVNKASSTVEITSDDPDPSTVDQSVHVEFTVTGTGGTPTGDVTITARGGTETCTGTLSGGSGACDIILTAPGTGANNRRLTATYGGDAQFSGDTDNENHDVIVTTVASTVQITSDAPDPSIVGQSVHVEFTVMGSGGTPTGNVTITVSGGPETCTGALSGGSGACDIVLTVLGDTRIMTATYSGDGTFSGDTDTENHRVDPAPNLPPVAQDDSYQINEGQVLTVPGPDNLPTLLANDSDPEGGPLSVTDAGDPQNGTRELTGGGGFTYTPNPGFVGTDQFMYVVTDQGNESSTAIVTIEVLDVP
jgi:hypothetical protein